ncbi:MAG: methylmalonyl Co-A mutase-associated GTPase MeaB [Bacteroidia bacterium]
MNHINPNIKRRNSSKTNLEELKNGILSGNRTSLSRAITLVESQHPKHRLQAFELLNWASQQKNSSIRIGITGVPGAGKSTLIESFGLHIIEKGHKVAVLAIDPSSQNSRGSILGDKTRMEELGKNERAFIRPSAAGKHLGGVAGKTKEAMTLCEAAGYDVILIETVGVGQSEIAVKEMVDFFLLVLVAGAGDELQGIKRGIMEMADMILINKAEGDNKVRAQASKIEYSRALSLFATNASKWKPKVALCSALERLGIENCWQTINSYLDLTKANNFYSDNRKKQNVKWFDKTIKSGLLEIFYENPGLMKTIAEKSKNVANNQIDPIAAAYELIQSIDVKIVAT